MGYKFILTYEQTDAEERMVERECSPIYSDELSVVSEMERDEWYSKRNLDGELTFVRGDYDWIMSCPFDGTFKLSVMSSTDGGSSWQSYIEGTFSRANLEIDEDNRKVVLNGLNEGGEYTVIENGKKEEYDLMKIIPDSEAKEVQGQVYPALAMVDYRSTEISKSDLWCRAAMVGAGYQSGKNGWSINSNPMSDISWNFVGLYVEAVVETEDAANEVNGIYVGKINYGSHTSGGHTVYGPIGAWNAIKNKNNCSLQIDFDISVPYNDGVYPMMRIWNSDGTSYSAETLSWKSVENGYYSPNSLEFSNGLSFYKKVTFFFHYIRATLLTQDIPVSTNSLPIVNILDTGDYYKGMTAFEGSGLTIETSFRTVEQPNGHRLVPGTGEQGTEPQYFAPPEDNAGWIPLAEDNWNYGSMWYKIEPSVANGLLDPSKVGSFRWARCWTLGTCIDRLLKKISGGKVSFDQSVAGSEFLYSTVNPLTQGEPFEYLFTQKSNVMRPSVGGESAARCIVRLDWFLEFIKNALGCYWWLEERNGGTYAFRVEHVEWFRRGGSYTGQLDGQIDLTQIKTRRNFVRNGEAVKHLDDDLHKYSYDMNGMTEKYTYSWQGDGGSDAFKGNPMFFKAGWIEKGTSESKEVDNIFADLSWLMLNAGTDTESSKNYDGLFVFAGYQIMSGLWTENSNALVRYMPLYANTGVCVTAPLGQVMNVELYNEVTGISTVLAEYTGTGSAQVIANTNKTNYVYPLLVRVDFGVDYADVVIHRFFMRTGNVYRVPNVEDRLGSGYLQNGPLAWPWLQNEYLHYDIPARKWSFDSDDIETATFEATGTVKMCKMQDVPMLPLPSKNDENKLEKGVKGGLRDSQGQLQTGIVKSAEVNLGTRNAKLTLMYDMIS